MKAKTILIAILSIGLIFTACEKDELRIVPSAEISTRTISVSEFSELEVSDNFKVYISFSDEESVQIEANSNVHDVIRTNQSGEHFKVGLANNSHIQGEVVLILFISTADIEKIDASGVCSINFQNSFTGNVLDLSLEGACEFSGNIQTNELFTDAEGASKLVLTGTSEYFEINADGASQMTGYEFSTDELLANIQGGSQAMLTVNQKIDVSASGASKLYYKGNASIEKQEVSGGSEIINTN